MAIKNIFHVPLDKKQPGASKIEVVEDDTGNVIVITLTDAGAPVDLTGCQVLAMFSKPDGTVVQQDNNGHGVTTDGNQITIDLYNGSFSPGKVNCEIEIYSTEDEPYDTLVTTAQFNFTCRRRIANQNTLPAQPSWPILEGALQELAGIKRGVQADYAQEDSDSPAYIKNKPIVGTDLQSATQLLPSAEGAVADTATVPFYDQNHKAVSWAQIKSWMATALSAAFSVVFAPLTHKSRHAAEGSDALTPGDIGAASLDGGIVIQGQARSKILTKTASFTLAAGDVESIIFSNSTNAITVTIPNESTYNFPAGTTFNFVRWNSGALSFSFASGVYCQAVNGISSVSAQNGAATLVKSPFANSWWLTCG